ncbi:hypothetical protein V6N13_048414 [Hibiscus sabdariffa]
MLMQLGPKTQKSLRQETQVPAEAPVGERKEYVIIESVPNEPGTNPPRASKDKFEKHMDDMLDVGCLVLATITLELQKLHEYVVSYEMIQNLEEIFEGKTRQ